MPSELDDIDQARYPHEPRPGKTHYAGCWRAPGHHNCAVAKVYRSARALAQVHAPAIDELLDIVEEEAGEDAARAIARLRDVGLKEEVEG